MTDFNLKLDKEFEKFVCNKEVNEDGIKYEIHFPNGYGASIARFNGSLAYKKGLWNLKITSCLKRLRNGDYEYDIEYHSLVDYDTLGLLQDEQINEILFKIKEGKIDEYISSEIANMLYRIYNDDY